MVVGHAGRAAALFGALALLAGCSGGTKASDANGSFTAPDIPAQRSVGSGEGQVNIVAWAGYVEDGSTDPKADWVSQFTKDTGCKVNSKVAGTSDEMVSLMKTGAYDVVSASGDATLRLIAAGDVAPVNLDLTPSYRDVFDGLKNQPYNTVKGKSYGVPQGRGANVLLYRTDVVKPAPDSWGVMWQANSPYKGKMMGYDSPIYIADAALYLMKTKPELGITNRCE
jgi:putative spermidine/putrescine transport system substrate-binding protein